MPLMKRRWSTEKRTRKHTVETPNIQFIQAGSGVPTRIYNSYVSVVSVRDAQVAILSIGLRASHGDDSNAAHGGLSEFCTKIFEKRRLRMSLINSRRVLSLFVALAILLSAFASIAATPRPPVEIQLLSVSDWHAQLDPLSVTGVGNVGGAAVLSAY